MEYFIFGSLDHFAVLQPEHWSIRNLDRRASILLMNDQHIKKNS